MIEIKNKAIQETDLNKTFMSFIVYWDGLDEDTRQTLMEAGYDADEDDMCDMLEADIERLNVPYDAVNWDNGYDSSEEHADYMEQLLKSANHYLVFAQGCCWDGASGYLLTESTEKLVRLSYDTSIYPTATSRGKKVLQCREYSHDVPMGSTTYLIALTDREYQILANATFAEVEKFVSKCTGQAIA